MSTQKSKKTKILACIDPHYWPRISDFRLLLAADIVIVLDSIPARHIAFGKQTAESNPVNVAQIRSIPLVVPFQRTVSQTFRSLRCRLSGWQSEHTHDLLRAYKGHSHNLSPVMDMIAHWPVGYVEGIRRMWTCLLENNFISRAQYQKIIFMSDLPGKMRGHGGYRTSVIAALGKRFGVTTLLFSTNQPMRRRTHAIRAYELLQDVFDLPAYDRRASSDPSIIDLIAMLGHLGMKDYFTMIASKEGWQPVGGSK